MQIMQWRRSGGNLIAIYVVGTIVLGWFLNWFLGNFFYNTLWTIVGDHLDYKEADLISYFLGNFIPFVLATYIIAAIYGAVRYELNKTYSRSSKTSKPLEKTPRQGGTSHPPPVESNNALPDANPPA